jgi:DNA-binding MarR family transcriptional regulator
MNAPEPFLMATVDGLLETLPSAWDRIRSNLRAAAIEKFGISLEQFHVLRYIRGGCHSVSELAERKKISRPAASQALEALVAKGLVTRTQESGDRRCVYLELTTRASEVLDANFKANRDWMRVQMASLSEDELKAIQKAMGILKKTFSPEGS